MAVCRCEEIEQCRKQISVLEEQDREREKLEKDIVRISELYGNMPAVRKESYRSLHKGALDKRNIILKKRPGEISENTGRQIRQRKAEIEVTLRDMQGEDRQFHEEEKEREEREKAEMLILGRR